MVRHKRKQGSGEVHGMKPQGIMNKEKNNADL